MNPIIRRLALEEIAMVSAGVLALEPTAPRGATAEPGAAEHPYLKEMRQRLKPQRRMLADGTTVIPVSGVLARKPDPFEMAFYGVEDSDFIRQMIEDARRDPDTTGAILDVDSPGGMVTGGLEVSDAAEALAKDKPTVAWVSGICASLGYHIASAGSRIIASRSAMVGSIGTIISYLDWTRYLKERGIDPVVVTNKEAHLKATTAPGVEMDKRRMAYLQQRVEDCAAEFHATVKRRRGALNEEAKSGAVYIAERAQGLGLIDGIGGLDWAVANLRDVARARR